jgi:hypothetical protein
LVTGFEGLIMHQALENLHLETKTLEFGFSCIQEKGENPERQWETIDNNGVFYIAPICRQRPCSGACERAPKARIL